MNIPNSNRLFQEQKVLHLLDLLNEQKCLLQLGILFFQSVSLHLRYHLYACRAHPNAPNKPPFETVASLLGAPFDKLRDLFEKFPKTQ